MKDNFIYGVIGFISVNVGDILNMIEIKGMVQAFTYGCVGAIAGLFVKCVYEKLFKK